MSTVDNRRHRRKKICRRPLGKGNLRLLMPTVTALFLAFSCTYTSAQSEFSTSDLPPKSLLIQEVLGGTLNVTDFDDSNDAQMLALQASLITPPELDRCQRELSEVAGPEGLVDKYEFITFLEDFSGRSLLFERFDQLPLSLVMIFFVAACTLGRDCRGENPTIDLDPQYMTRALSIIFCTAIKDVAAVQTEFRIQYTIRYEEDLTAQEILRGVGGSEIRTKLEQATEKVLLDDYGCDDWTQRRAREFIVADHIMALFEDSTLSSDLSSVYYDDSSSFSNQKDQSQEHEQAMERVLQTVGFPQCDFRVQARIIDMLDLDCEPPPETPATKCALVVSEVFVTAASLDQDIERSELRSSTSETLKYFFTDNRLAPYVDVE